MARRIVGSPIGRLVVVTTAVGVRNLGWSAAAGPEDADRSSEAVELLDRTLVELSEYFTGARRTFTVPVDRRERTGFHGAVLDALERVPFGHTVTYGELAARAGRPRAARAVGSAMATNPVAVLVPCHRVVPGAGGIGRYGGGVDAKAFLLRLEGATVRGSAGQAGGGPMTTQPL